jgi:hypothetical protein
MQGLYGFPQSRRLTFRRGRRMIGESGLRSFAAAQEALVPYRLSNRPRNLPCAVRSDAKQLLREETVSFQIAPGHASLGGHHGELTAVTQLVHIISRRAAAIILTARTRADGTAVTTKGDS